MGMPQLKKKKKIDRLKKNLKCYLKNFILRGDLIINAIFK